MPRALREQRHQLAEEPFRLLLRSSCEVEVVRVAEGLAVAVLEVPEAVELHGRAVGCAEVVDELARLRVEGEDAAVAEVADQQLARERAEVLGGHHQAPGGDQLAPLLEALEQATLGVEAAHEAVAGVGL